MSWESASVRDPKTQVAAQNPAVYKEMYAAILEHNKTVYSPIRGADDGAACEKAVGECERYAISVSSWVSRHHSRACARTLTVVVVVARRRLLGAISIPGQGVRLPMIL